MWQIVMLQLLCCTLFFVTCVSGEPPRIVDFTKSNLDQPGDVKFGKDQSTSGFVIFCKATGSNLKHAWKHNGTDIASGLYGHIYTLTSDGTLRGGMLSTRQGGTYQCFVTDEKTGISTFSRKVTVIVTVVKDFTDKAGGEKAVTLGSKFSLPCPAHGYSYGIVFKWESQDRKTVIDRSSSIAITSDGTLFLMFVTEADVNRINTILKGIRCTISAANSYYSSGVYTLKPPPGQTDPGISKPPSWEIPLPSNDVAIQGQSKTLYCFAIGRPPPKITWDKNGVKINTNQNGYSLSFENRQLTIENVDRETHEDEYTCKAENTLNQGNPISSSTRLVVQVPPHWIMNQAPPEKITIDINGNGTLECRATGDPLPTFKWYKNGKEFTSNAQVQVDRNNLRFKNAQLEDDGVYQCVVESQLDMIVSSTWVYVLAKKPSFEDTGFGPFYLFQDSVGRLKCEPEAAPPAENVWLRDGQGIVLGDRYSLEDGALVIKKVNKAQDAVSYTCKARNFLGEASATASATVLKRTRITVPPMNRTVTEGTNIDLRCEAVKDDTLELRYLWKKDNKVITYNQKIVWLEGRNVLRIADIQVDDAGVYTCVAYTPDPKRSEDSASATVDIKGVPFPPFNLQITDCFNRTTNISWTAGASNDAPITHFLIEQESTYEPFVYRFLYNVTDPKVNKVSINLTAWATLRFRMRAINNIGPSRPSMPTAEGICTTKVGPPDKYPDNFRGVPKKAEELDIAWTRMKKIDQNGPEFYCILTYRKVGSAQWNRERITDPTVDVFPVSNPGYYELWEFQIFCGNGEDEGPKSPITKSYSGQDPPEGKPENVEVGEVTARSVDLKWNPVTVSRGSVDGYRSYYWGQSLVSARRRRRAIPSYASSSNVTGGSVSETTVTGLTPYTSYNLAIVAFNSGGEGPSSDEVAFNTLEAEPGVPSDVRVYPFAKYILVRWSPPAEPNGVITGYRVGVAEASTAPDNLDDSQFVTWTPNEFQKLMDNVKPLTSYAVEMQARTSIGWGDRSRKVVTTVALSPPAKPEAPTLRGVAIDQIEVIYNFGLGGGWTHDFKVLYRKNLDGEEFQETPMVDNFETQTTVLENLDPDMYEVKTTGKNDLGESEESEPAYGRPMPGVVNAGQRASTPIHKAAWFIVLIVLIVVLLLVLLIFVLYTRHRGAKYPVGKRESKRAALVDNGPYDEEEGPFNNGEENPPPYPSQGSLDKPDQDSDRDSMDEYGEGPQFKEDGSFVEEYGDDKKPAPDEKDQSAFATFV